MMNMNKERAKAFQATIVILATYLRMLVSGKSIIFALDRDNTLNIAIKLLMLVMNKATQEGMLPYISTGKMSREIGAFAQNFAILGGSGGGTLRLQQEGKQINFYISSANIKFVESILIDLGIPKSNIVNQYWLQFNAVIDDVDTILLRLAKEDEYWLEREESLQELYDAGLLPSYIRQQIADYTSPKRNTKIDMLSLCSEDFVYQEDLIVEMTSVGTEEILSEMSLKINETGKMKASKPGIAFDRTGEKDESIADITMFDKGDHLEMITEAVKLLGVEAIVGAVGDSGNDLSMWIKSMSLDGYACMVIPERENDQDYALMLHLCAYAVKYNKKLILIQAEEENLANDFVMDMLNNPSGLEQQYQKSKRLVGIFASLHKGEITLA